MTAARESATAPLKVLGRYALHEVIASGGMATVHYGRLLGPVGFARTVAIKRLHERLAQDPEFTSMFLDEARLAARVRHPNVVPTLDVVATEGEIFLVMEYVQGESLARLFRAERDRARRVPLPILVTILASALYGLHAAHEATTEDGKPLDIIHRDVSPQNILIGVDGVARVLDFGVAKAAGRASNTRDGQLKGKLSYMAPEQLRGKNMTRAVDVYAAGVVLWEGLVGRKLYRADSEAELIVQLLESRADAPSKHAADVPPELDAIVMKALSTDPKDRFATAREMARALEKLGMFAPASAVGEWVEEVADQVLAARAQRLSLIEQSSTSDVTAIAGSERSPDADLASEGQHTETKPGNASLSEGSALVLPVHGPHTKRLVVAVAGGAGLAVLVVVLFFFLRSPTTAPDVLPTSSASGAAAPAPDDGRRSIPPPSTAEPSAAGSASGAVASASASAAAPAPVAALSGSPRAVAALGTAPRIANPHPPSSGTARNGAPTAPPTTAAAPAAANCDPPYTIDANGARRYKRECMR